MQEDKNFSWGATIGLIASVVTLIIFITGYSSLPEIAAGILFSVSGNTATPPPITSTPDASFYIDNTATLRDYSLGVFLLPIPTQIKDANSWP